MDDSGHGGSSADLLGARLWGGGFREPMHPALAALSGSLAQDLPIAEADLKASSVYALALGRCGVLSREDASRLAAELDRMRSDLVEGRWQPAGAEDIHAAIESELVRRAGELGERLHTGRSRNDQVATAFRMVVRERATAMMRAAGGLQRALVDRAAEDLDTLMPAYTHWQRAQPVRLAHWLLSHFWPLERDIGRLAAARDQASVLPLGSGAATGHPFGIDRDWMAAQLGFTKVCANSLDAVGDRDFAVEFALGCCLLAVHLSRMAEEMVLFSSSEFGFLRWPDSLSTGSSLLPNKRNPDLAELVRARAAAAIGDATSLLVLLKGLAGSYQRDLQEDKPPVWRISQAALISLEAMTVAVERIEFDRDRMRAALTDDLLATEAADALVSRGVPFRRAHAAVSEAVAEARARGTELRETADLDGLDPEKAVERRAATGGTSRAAVLAQIARARGLMRGRS